MAATWAGITAASHDTPLRVILAAVDEGASGAAVVVNSSGRLLGIVTDGDCRRHLLRGGSLDDNLDPVLNRHPLTVGEGESRAAVLDLMHAYQIAVMPIVDPQGHLVGVHLFREMIGRRKRDNVCVLLAGGRGTRLGEVAKSIPKPMVRVAGRPILERLILQFMSHGISRFVISVGHLSEVIESYFGDGSEFGCLISYVRDPDGIALGTAGPLTLLGPEFLDDGWPLVVANGDLITQVNLGGMLDYHYTSSAVATVGVHRYRHQIPFGVISTDSDGVVCAVEEKPEHHWQVSAGINIVSASLVRGLPHSVPVLMTDVLQELVIRGERVGTFEVDEDWVDIGTPRDLSKAQGR
jgi:dTDP-glucose pyrophosphorylase